MILDNPHRRLNPLTGDWVLVSPQRSDRPWLGEIEKTPAENLPRYDPTCYLCPGNTRAEGIKNPKYTGTFVFDNDFSSLLPQVTPEIMSTEQSLLTSKSERGICKVICFSPRHDLTLPELDIGSIERVIETWAEQSKLLGYEDFIHNIQVFENKGAMMGCSNPHPHSQIWAQSEIPNETSRELSTQKAYHHTHGHTLLSDYLKEENEHPERILFQNADFSALVPFWAVWPFEVLLISRKPRAYLTELTPAEITSLAEITRWVTTHYDNLFEISFPYSMGFHQAPFDGEAHPEWTLHAHYYPPLLRSAMIRKFMVGYEMLAMPQRDITPESAAERIRSVPDVHYKHGQGPLKMEEKP